MHCHACAGSVANEPLNLVCVCVCPLIQGCQTGAMALKIAPMNVFERQRPFYGRHVPAK